ncbi:MAG: LysR substrate-binding domain-containing protein [Marinifilaceae bacterium]
MDFRYKVFLAVANNLSFSKAAEQLFISQPAVSKQIKELEKTHDIALFLRKGNRISLTPAGSIVYIYAQKAYSLHSDLNCNLGALKNSHKGTLRIGASSSITQYLIPNILANFHTRYPNISLEILNGNSFEMEQMLSKGKIDIALVENQTSKSDFNYQNFIEDEIVAIVGTQTSFAKLKYLNISDLNTIPLVLREVGSGTLQVIEKHFTKENIEIDKLNIVIHLGSTEAIKNFLSQYDAIGLVSIRSIEKELQLNTIKILPIKGMQILRNFRIALPKGPRHGFVDIFINFLEDYNQKL